MKRWLLTGAILTTVVGSGCAMNPAPYFSNPFAAATATDSPNRFDQQLSLARLHERQGKTDEALTIYRKVLADDPENLLANHRMGVIAAEQGDLDGAVRYFEIAQRRGSKDSELLAGLGYALYLKDDLPGAENALRRASEVAPQNGRARNNLAIVLGEQGRFDESLEAFREVVTEAQAYANIAYLQTQCGRHQDALANYHRAVELDPDLRPAGEALVQLEMRRRQAMHVAAAAKQTQQVASNIPPIPPQGTTSQGLQIPTPPVEAAPSHAELTETSPAPRPVLDPTVEQLAPSTEFMATYGSEAEQNQSSAANEPHSAELASAEGLPGAVTAEPEPLSEPSPAEPVSFQPLSAVAAAPSASVAPMPTKLVAATVPASAFPVEVVAAPAQRTRSTGVTVRMTDERNQRLTGPAATDFSVPTPTANVAYQQVSTSAPVRAVPIPAPVAGQFAPGSSGAVANARSVTDAPARMSDVEFVPLTPLPTNVASKPVTMRIASETSSQTTAPPTQPTSDASTIRILNHDAHTGAVDQPTVMRLSY